MSVARGSKLLAPIHSPPVRPSCPDAFSPCARRDGRPRKHPVTYTEETTGAPKPAAAARRGHGTHTLPGVRACVAYPPPPMQPQRGATWPCVAISSSRASIYPPNFARSDIYPTSTPFSGLVPYSATSQPCLALVIRHCCRATTVLFWWALYGLRRSIISSPGHKRSQIEGSLTPQEGRRHEPAGDYPATVILVVLGTR